jgi:hypothetical protein
MVDLVVLEGVADPLVVAQAQAQVDKEILVQEIKGIKLAEAVVEKTKVDKVLMVVMAHQAQLNQRHSLLAVVVAETVAVVVVVAKVAVETWLQRVKPTLAEAVEHVREIILLLLNQVVVVLFKSNYQLRRTQDKHQEALRSKHQVIKQF